MHYISTGLTKARSLIAVYLLMVVLQPLSLASDRTKGISAVFVKKSELMTGNSWSSEPLSIQDAVKNMSRYDAVWCAQLIEGHNPRAWSYLRKNNPEKLMLRYISGCTCQVDGTFTTLDYKYINEHHPEWFLLADNRKVEQEDYKDPNKRTRWNTTDKKHTYYNRFYLDVANKNFEEWAAEQILTLVSGSKEQPGYDGVAVDNVYVGKRLHDRFKFEYPHWKYADNLKSWSQGYADYLKTVKKVLNEHGFILVANHNPVGHDRAQDDHVWNLLYESVDGILTEQALRSGWKDDSYFVEDEWLASIERHEEILGKGLINWWVCNPSASGNREHEAFLYTYCSWLLIKQPGKSFYSASTPSNQNAVPWYDEYDLPIGEPISPRYLQNNCWIRDYANAKIIVNPTKKKQKVTIDSEKKWLDWTSKEAVNQLKLPPRSARIMLPIFHEAN